MFTKTVRGPVVALLKRTGFAKKGHGFRRVDERGRLFEVELQVRPPLGTTIPFYVNLGASTRRWTAWRMQLSGNSIENRPETSTLHEQWSARLPAPPGRFEVLEESWRYLGPSDTSCGEEVLAALTGALRMMTDHMDWNETVEQALIDDRRCSVTDFSDAWPPGFRNTVDRLRRVPASGGFVEWLRAGGKPPQPPALDHDIMFDHDIMWE